MEGDAPEEGFEERVEIPRGDTVLRILITIVFAIVASVLRTVVSVIVVFELLWALITQGVPPTRLREFANAVIAYQYRLLRYVTYNESTVPFPFSRFPQVLEPIGAPHEAGDTDLRDLLRGEGADED